MATFKKREVQRALVKKGFKRDKSRTNHNIYYFYDDKGEKTSIHTMLSHNNKDITDSMLGKLSKELRLRKDELIQYFECTLSKDDYINILRKNKTII